MRLNQAEYLFMLAEDARDQGDEFVDEMRQRGMVHAKRILELSDMIDRAKDTIEREKSRFAQYLPNEPRRPELTQAPKTSQTLSSPREVLKKAAEG